MEEKEYLNIKEASKVLGISTKLMTKLTYQDGFPCIRFTRRTVIDKEAMKIWILKNSNKFIK